MRLPNKQERELMYWGGPTAIINYHKNNHIMHPIKNPMRNFFICKYGLFMTDSQTEYRHNKQTLSFFNSHGENIPEEIVKNVESYYNQMLFIRCRKELEKIYPNLIKGKNFKTIYELFEEIVNKTEHYAIDLNTEKYLPYMEAYVPIALKKLYLVANEARIAIEKLSPPSMSKLIPLGIYLIVGIIVIALIQNAPKWIRELRAEFDKLNLPDEGGLILGAIQYMNNLT